MCIMLKVKAKIPKSDSNFSSQLQLQCQFYTLANHLLSEDNIFDIGMQQNVPFPCQIMLSLFEKKIHESSDMSSLILAQIFCSTRRLVEDFLLDVQYKFSTGHPVVEKQLPTRSPIEGINIYQISSSRKIALLDLQQNFYWMSSRTFTRHLVEQMIWAIFLARS